jgi:hypothetical protein
MINPIIWRSSHLGIFILHCGSGVPPHLLKTSNILRSLKQAEEITSSEIYPCQQFQLVFSATKMGTETIMFNHGVRIFHPLHSHTLQNVKNGFITEYIMR